MIAWVDEETGFSCIMLRQEHGTLSGRVSANHDHQVLDRPADAVPVDGVGAVRGEVTYVK